MGRIAKLFFVDVETTDLPENDPAAEIVEIACGVLDLETWEVSGEWSTLVAHSRPFGTQGPCPPCEVFRLTDFTNAPLLWRALAELFRRWRACGGAWTGQNPTFDLRFVRDAADRLIVDMPRFPDVDYHVFDVASMMLPRMLRGEVEGVGLSKTRLWAGCEGGYQTHRAAQDVSDTIRVFVKHINAGNPAFTYLGGLAQ